MDKQHVTHIVLQRNHASPSYSERETAAVSHLSVSAIRRLRVLGLVEGVQVGGKQRYSEEDVMQLRRIRRLQYDLGVNLAGVEVILRLLKLLEAIPQDLA